MCTCCFSRCNSAASRHLAQHCGYTPNMNHTHLPNCKKVKLPPYCLSGGAPHPFSQPHRRSVPEEPGQRPSAAMSSVCSGACKAQLRFTQNYLPLSLSSGLPTQVPPSPEHQWYLPLLIQLLTYKHQNLLQDQERWVKKEKKKWPLQDEHSACCWCKTESVIVVMSVWRLITTVL